MTSTCLLILLLYTLVTITISTFRAIAAILLTLPIVVAVALIVVTGAQQLLALFTYFEFPKCISDRYLRVTNASECTYSFHYLVQS